MNFKRPQIITFEFLKCQNQVINYKEIVLRFVNYLAQIKEHNLFINSYTVIPAVISNKLFIIRENWNIISSKNLLLSTHFISPSLQTEIKKVYNITIYCQRFKRFIEIEKLELLTCLWVTSVIKENVS